MRRNLLYIIESSETGGAEMIFADLVRRVDRSRYVPHVALLSKGWLFDRLLADGAVPVVIETRRGGFDVRLFNGIRSLLSRLRIDLVHSHLFTTNVYASVCGALAGVPVISTFHGTIDVNRNDVFGKAKWRIMNRFSRRVVFVSSYLRDYFLHRNLARCDTSVVIHNGIAFDRFDDLPSKTAIRRELGISPSASVVGCVGDLRPPKDYETVLRAVALLRDVVPELVLVVVGAKTALLERLEALAISLGISDTVAFLGFRADVQNILPAFDVYLSASISEGFSLSVVEAMAAGVPVVATRSGGPEEIVENGVTGVLVEVGAAEKIADALFNVLAAPDRGRKMAASARDAARSRFSLDAMMATYHSLYAEVVAGGAGG